MCLTGKWTYKVDSTNPIVQALHEGNDGTDTFQIKVADDSGAISEVKVITVTITGVNDIPTITFVDADNQITEAGVQAAGATHQGPTANGSVTTADVDSENSAENLGLAVDLTVSGLPAGEAIPQAMNKVVNTQGTTVTNGTTKYFAHHYGFLTATFDGTKWDWTYTVADLAGSWNALASDHNRTDVQSAFGSEATFNAALDAMNKLNSTDSVTVELSWTVTDARNATANVKQTFTITGANDAPVATVATGADLAITENGSNDTASGSITPSDVDAGDNPASLTLKVKIDEGNEQNVTNGTVLASNYGFFTFTWNSTKWDWTFTAAEAEWASLTDAQKAAFGNTQATYETAKALVDALGGATTATATTAFTATFTDGSGAVSTDTPAQIVTITGVNDAPTVTTSGTARGILNTQTGAIDTGFTISKSDPENAPTTYVFSDKRFSEANGKIIITSATPLTAGEHTTTVSASDGTLNSSPKTITITVGVDRSVTVTPVFTNGLSPSDVVALDTNGDTASYTPTLTSSGTYTFSLVNHTDKFTINQTTGEITPIIVNAGNNAIAKPYNVQIMATNTAPDGITKAEATQTVSVTVKKSWAAPTGVVNLDGSANGQQFLEGRNSTEEDSAEIFKVDWNTTPTELPDIIRGFNVEVDKIDADGAPADLTIRYTVADADGDGIADVLIYYRIAVAGSSDDQFHVVAILDGLGASWADFGEPNFVNHTSGFPSVRFSPAVRRFNLDSVDNDNLGTADLGLSSPSGATSGAIGQVPRPAEHQAPLAEGYQDPLEDDLTPVVHEL